MAKMKFYACAVVICLLAAMPLTAQAPSLTEVYAQIKAEETSNSKIMWIIHEIADVYGPRLTGTPNLKHADDWAVKTMTSWGLSNAHLEPWTFQPPSAATPVPGWENTELLADAVTPFHGQLMVKPLAWTPSTKGVIDTTVVMLTPPGLGGGGAGGRGGFGGGRGGAPPLTCEDTSWAPPTMPAPPTPPAAPAAAPAAGGTPAQGAAPAGPPMPTQAELDAYLNSMKAKVRGHIVMVGRHVEVREDCYPAPLRRTLDQWKEAYDPNNPGGGRRGGGGGGGRRGGAGEPDGRLTAQEVTRAIDNFLVDNGAAVRINDAGRAYGVIVAQQSNYYDWTRVVPTLIMRNEDYGRISRILADGTPVTLKINIQNKLYPEGKTVYDAVGEIHGSDKADEVVMLGGHYDSWHGATGATDNGIGSSMMLEAIRILAALHVKPRRTIRVALWSGEEEGLLGSLAYVANHFGSAEKPKPEFAKLDVYLNIDDGTGKPRGAGIFGPPEAATPIRTAMMQFADWGFTGVSTTGSRQTGGTDSTSFNNAGLPGVNLSQDPFDYNSFTHHTNLDTYERIYEDDVREGAVEIASAAYALAMADEMIPRFAPDKMPPPAPEPGPGTTAVPRPKPAAPAGRGAAAKPAAGRGN